MPTCMNAGTMGMRVMDFGMKEKIKIYRAMSCCRRSTAGAGGVTNNNLQQTKSAQTTRYP